MVELIWRNIDGSKCSGSFWEDILKRYTVKIVEVEYETDIMSNALVASELKG